MTSRHSRIVTAFTIGVVSLALAAPALAGAAAPPVTTPRGAQHFAAAATECSIGQYDISDLSGTSCKMARFVLMWTLLHFGVPFPPWTYTGNPLSNARFSCDYFPFADESFTANRR